MLRVPPAWQHMSALVAPLVSSMSGLSHDYHLDASKRRRWTSFLHATGHQSQLAACYKNRGCVFVCKGVSVSRALVIPSSHCFSSGDGGLQNEMPRSSHCPLPRLNSHRNTIPGHAVRTCQPTASGEGAVCPPFPFQEQVSMASISPMRINPAFRI